MYMGHVGSLNMHSAHAIVNITLLSQSAGTSLADAHWLVRRFSAAPGLACTGLHPFHFSAAPHVPRAQITDGPFGGGISNITCSMQLIQAVTPPSSGLLGPAPGTQFLVSPACFCKRLTLFCGIECLIYGMRQV